MQTFLPYPDFIKSAHCLDDKRLGKQRVECKQILKALLGEYPSGAWGNHPATLMWKGNEGSLACYGQAICHVWINRGYNDSLFGYFTDYIHLTDNRIPWLGNKDFHASHRSNLLRKDPVWYGQFGWTEPDNLEYVWPTKVGLM